ncbi:MAG: hypothetical protein IJS68_01600 [Clostridia bacterium]|nr:hypothetical protein [Clostridia bacterium]
MQNKIKTYIGFAIKSGEFALGVDNILKARKVAIILVDEVLGENSCRKLYNKFDGSIIRKVANLTDITNGAMAFAITNKELASACNKILSGEDGGNIVE